MKLFFKLKMILEGYILEVKERKNEPRYGLLLQMLIKPFLVFSAIEPDFSTALLDRFLVLIEFNRIRPIICITKMDLMTEDEKQSTGASHARIMKEQDMMLY